MLPLFEASWFAVSFLNPEPWTLSPRCSHLFRACYSFAWSAGAHPKREIRWIMLSIVGEVWGSALVHSCVSSLVIQLHAVTHFWVTHFSLCFLLGFRAGAPFTTKECGTTTVVVWRSALLPYYYFYHKELKEHKENTLLCGLCASVRKKKQVNCSAWALHSPTRSLIKEQCFRFYGNAHFMHTRTRDTRYLFFTMTRIYHRRAGRARRISGKF